jgi:transposase
LRTGGLAAHAGASWWGRAASGGAVGPLAPAQQVLGDAADDSDALWALIAEAGANAFIHLSSRRKNWPFFDLVACKCRHHIERTFSRFKEFRRIATRYDKREHSFDAFICLSVITLYLNREQPLASYDCRVTQMITLEFKRER